MGTNAHSHNRWWRPCVAVGVHNAGVVVVVVVVIGISAAVQRNSSGRSRGMQGTSAAFLGGFLEMGVNRRRG